MARVVTVTISCPITWHDQTNWIYRNCKEYSDLTNWAAWSIGVDDIQFALRAHDAVLFTLVWS